MNAPHLHSTPQLKPVPEAEGTHQGAPLSARQLKAQGPIHPSHPSLTRSHAQAHTLIPPATACPTAQKLQLQQQSPVAQRPPAASASLVRLAPRHARSDAFLWQVGCFKRMHACVHACHHLHHASVRVCVRAPCSQRMQRKRTRTHACMHARTHTHARTHARTHAHTHARTRAQMRRALDAPLSLLPLDSLPSAALAAVHAALCAPADPATGVHHPRDAAAFRCACRTFSEVAMLPDRLKVGVLRCCWGACVWSRCAR